MKPFLILGILSTSIDFFIYTLCLVVGIEYIISIVLGYGSGFLFNFYAGRKFVFKEGVKVNHKFKELLFVFIIAIIGLLINILVVFILTQEMFSLDLIISRVLAILLAFIWNYYARKLFVYY